MDITVNEQQPQEESFLIDLGSAAGSFAEGGSASRTKQHFSGALDALNAAGQFVESYDGFNLWFITAK